MKSILLLVALICVALARPAWDDHEAKRLFTQFKTQYNKSYATAKEEQLRFGVFKESMIRAQQSQAKNPKARFGVTKFSDLTPEEFSRMYKMPNFDGSKFPRPPVKDFSKPQPPLSLPGCSPDKSNFDWGSCGVTTPVYNQEQCGSCWAFSATETIESYFALGGGTLTQLSMQQIVDCDTSDQGCNGGFPSSAYTYVQNAGGLDPLADYPYTAEDGTCNFNSQEVAATVTSQQSISGEDGLYQQASTAGPVSVCVDASSWQDYSGGILTQCSNNVDHCVQLTGYYNYGQSGAYWNVRNSWGTDWGQSGYIWIEIGQDLCSIGDYATIVSAQQ
jgi:cysteine peptidase B